MVAWIIGNGSSEALPPKIKQEADSANETSCKPLPQVKPATFPVPARPDSPLNAAPGSPVSPSALQHTPYSPASPVEERQTSPVSSPVMCPPALPEVPFFPSIPAPKPCRRHG